LEERYLCTCLYTGHTLRVVGTFVKLRFYLYNLNASWKIVVKPYFELNFIESFIMGGFIYAIAKTLKEG